ncbi:DUF1573 domain-containing protein [Fuerstiella marisgermanici]|uniref:DUF1573 domain-containing protein n=1 Tax=Fuerstiella marisgermanici TaxID=1891926 RepID=A0A1P8WLW2_9PLAN|nr:DUF1573 domain-containing protein [Fuerstiella marisgermanici]APZ95027.1 hypothetical protein Fuma_04679 [Fuerstiella marisgermanici]
MNEAETNVSPRKAGLLLLCGLLPCFASAAFTMRSEALPPLAATKPRPSLVFAPYLYHHGEFPVEPGSTLYSEFVFRNDGNEVVNIGEIERSCGCLSPRLSANKRDVAPGETGSFIVPLQTIKQAPGPHEYTLTVHYTDPQPQTATLSIKATFPKKMVVVQPTALYLSQNTEKSVPFQVAINDFRDKTLKVTEVQTTAWFVSAKKTSSSGSQIVQTAYTEKEEGASDDDEYLPAAHLQIDGEVAGGIPAGHHDVVIAAKTDDPEFPVITVPMTINGPSYPAGEAPMASPAQFRLVAGNHPSARRSETVKVIMPHHWKVSHAAAWPEALSVEFDEGVAISDSQKVVTMQVELTELPAAGTEHGVVQLIANEGNDLVTVKAMFYWP